MSTVDPLRWPAIANVPEQGRIRRRARKAESEFAYACEQAGLSLEGADADLRVLEDALFLRIADAGWLGLAESYMAGEWLSSNLPHVLQRLLETGYAPKSNARPKGLFDARATPVDLLRLSAGEGLFSYASVFSSGVPTTERITLPPPGRGKMKSAQPLGVEVTTLSDPTVVERLDQSDAQARAVATLLDMADVGTGTYLADVPAQTPAVALAAIARNATVDVMSCDEELVEELEAVASKAQGALEVCALPGPLPEPGRLRRRFDAVVSVDGVEAMDPGALKTWLHTCEQVLVPGGHVALETLVATEALKPLDSALDVLRAYLAPGWHGRSMEQVLHSIHAQPGLKPQSVLVFGGHYVEGLRLQRERFEAHQREAAALGFDAVYRRLWIFQLALKEALLRAGLLDAVMISATLQPRRAV
ncbi:class I SAM-dependent methyltransferase [Corynebacterium pelargi]|uniref:Cyclopropane fatty acyl phospholipid synthase n=1 Tax=Corynebacterium pelargi TaxID=1471400 RepID=A0A410W8Y4_9CORY|nr:class I SAM-dependent methyltransferase [Corynebacterium pelargi]QAU52410.1 cyclopropane fatty acyl phospholipid synthase [Corynebacterium pelargi]GGG67886.1 cyclopropane-fatty-acyl-phospholipid synthase [Corynebacterium pelargi]